MPAPWALLLAAAATAHISRVVVAQSCGLQAGGALCPDGQCCGPDGECGDSEAFCLPPGCQSGCWGCGNGKCEGTLYESGENTGNCPEDCGPYHDQVLMRECVLPSDYVLSFDDGPSPVTPHLLSILAETGVKASFFLVGTMLTLRPGTVLEMEEGHVLASHSFSHPDLTTLTDASVFREVSATELALSTTTCVRPKIFRPPFGALLPHQLQLVQNMGYTVVNWNLDSEDWQYAAQSEDAFVRVIENQIDLLTPGSIIHLQHDLLQESADAVPRIVDMVRGKGYRFVDLNECIYGPNFERHPSYVFQRRACPEGVIPSGDEDSCVLSEWSSWSPCSTPCGDGHQTRVRYAVYPLKQQALCRPYDYKQQRPCRLATCPGDCEMSDWSEWGPCSATCNGGTRGRTRNVLAEATAPDGSCGDTVATEACNTTPCEGDCEVSEWSAWLPCSEPCGGGERTRFRSVVTEAWGGGTCDADLSDTQACNTQACPTACQYSEWGAWGACSLTCGGGVTSRTRTAVVGQAGGAACDAATQTLPCNTQACPRDCVVGLWSEWSACSAACGGGLRNRTRAVALPAVAPGQCALPAGTLTDSQPCNSGACAGALGCVFGEWSAWGACSDTCGTGVHHRRRPLVSSGAAVCGTPTQAAACNTAPCPRDCRVTEWSPWSPCSAACGGGVTSRSRTMLEAAVPESAPCTAATTQTLPCNAVPCAATCTVSPWSPWSPCGDGCDRARRTRNRTVVDAGPPGTACPQPLTDSRPCAQPLTTSSTVCGTVTPGSLALPESGSVGTYVLRLQCQPASTVTLKACSAGVDLGYFVVSPPSVVVTPTNWDQPFYFTVQAVGNDVDLTDTTFPLVHVPDGFAPTPFDTAVIADGELVVSDDDTSVAVPSANVVRVTEGKTATYSVQLSSPPLAPVRVAVVPADTTVVASPSEFTLTADTWTDGQVVTLTVPVDDVDNGGILVPVTVQHLTYSAQSSYNSAQGGNVTVEVLNDDVAGVVFPNTPAWSFSEGSDVTVPVRLSSQPRQPVTLTPFSVGDASLAFHNASVIFTAATWNTTVHVVATTSVVEPATRLDGVAVFHVESRDAVYGSMGSVAVPFVAHANRGPVAQPGRAGVTVLPPLTQWTGHNATAVLDGSMSVDPDRNALSYQWQALHSFTRPPAAYGQGVAPDEPPAAVHIADATAERTEVTLPGPGAYTFLLTVADTVGLTSAAVVTVWVPLLVTPPQPAAGAGACYIGTQCVVDYAWHWLPVATSTSTPSAADLTGAHPGNSVTASHRLSLEADGLPLHGTGLAVGQYAVAVVDSNAAIGYAQLRVRWDVPATVAPRHSAQLHLRVWADAVTTLGDAVRAFDVSASGTAFNVATPFRYALSDWSQCSTPCDTGTQRRSATCVDVRTAATAYPARCAALPAPVVTRPCFQRPCAAAGGWRVGDWGACHPACGPNSTQARAVECVTASGNVVADAQCVAAKPVAQQRCRHTPCDTFRWDVTPWSGCVDEDNHPPLLGSCGNGVQRRAVFCASAVNGSRVAAELCAALPPPPPPSVQPCKLQGLEELGWPCVLPRLLWAGPFGACNASCGTHARAVREVACLSTTSKARLKMQDCTTYPGFEMATPPSSSARCNMQLCPEDVVQWVPSPWSVCEPLRSVSAGDKHTCGGTRFRTLSCRTADGLVMPDYMCNWMRKPAATEPCGVCNHCYPPFVTSRDSVAACSGHGACNADGHTCSCDDGWGGALCNAPATCQSGVVGADGDCCATVLDAAGQCCSRGDTATLDGDGNCCYEDVDGCGVCGGTNVGLDNWGQCCSGAVDAAGQCCPRGYTVDHCGVCAGTGSCAATLVSTVAFPASFSAGDVTDPASPQWAAASAQLATALAAALDVSATRVTVGNAAAVQLHGDARRRLSLGPTVQVSVVVEPVSPLAPNVVPVHSLPRAFVLDNGAAVVDTVLGPVRGVCGNGLCEVGERCSATDEQASCCAQDCLLVAADCPLVRDQPCGAHGDCVVSVLGGRVCACLTAAGYTGEDCNACAPGFVASNVSASGAVQCVRGFAPSVFLPPPPSNEVLWGATAPQLAMYGAPAAAAALLATCGAAMWLRKRRKAKQFLAKMKAGAPTAQPVLVSPRRPAALDNGKVAADMRPADAVVPQDPLCHDDSHASEALTAAGIDDDTQRTLEKYDGVGLNASMLIRQYTAQAMTDHDTDVPKLPDVPAAAPQTQGSGEDDDDVEEEVATNASRSGLPLLNTAASARLLDKYDNPAGTPRATPRAWDASDAPVAAAASPAHASSPVSAVKRHRGKPKRRHHHGSPGPAAVAVAAAVADPPPAADMPALPSPRRTSNLPKLAPLANAPRPGGEPAADPVASMFSGVAK